MMKLLHQTCKMQNSFRSMCAPEPACPAGKHRLVDRVSESTPESMMMEIEMILTASYRRIFEGLANLGSRC